MRKEADANGEIQGGIISDPSIARRSDVPMIDNQSYASHRPRAILPAGEVELPAVRWGTFGFRDNSELALNLK